MASDTLVCSYKSTRRHKSQYQHQHFCKVFLMSAVRVPICWKMENQETYILHIFISNHVYTLVIIHYFCCSFILVAGTPFRPVMLNLLPTFNEVKWSQVITICLQNKVTTTQQCITATDWILQQKRSKGFNQHQLACNSGSRLCR
jgi:hypothetical protein